MKKFGKIAFGLALVGAVCAMLLAPTPAQATWVETGVTLTGAGYYAGNASSTDTGKLIYITFTYNSTSYVKYANAGVSDINQQLATALTALSNGGAAIVRFDDALTSAGLFSRIRAGN